MLSAFVNSIALCDQDQAWRNTFQESMVGRFFSLIVNGRANIENKTLRQFASVMQFFSFLLVLVLFSSLGLRQFANDKEGLAIIASVSFCLWLAGYVLGGQEERQTTALDVVVILFLGANIVATSASHYFKPSLIGLAKVLIYICSYFSFSAILGQSKRRQITVVSVLVLSGFLVALYGLYQYKIGVAPLATWEDPTIEQKGVRIYSTLGNPNLLAGYLVPIAPLAFALGLMAISAKRWLIGFAAMAISSVISIAIVLTGSRGGWLGLFACAMMMLWLVVGHIWIKQPRLKPILLTAIVLLALAVPAALHFVPTFEQRLQSIFVGYEHSSNAFRLNVWRSSFKMFLDNWWFGIGPGNQAFILAYGLYMTSGFDALGAYCVPLEVAIETGIIGLIFFVVLVVSSLARGHLAFWQEEDNQTRWLVEGVSTALVGLIAHGLVDTVFYRPQVQFIFWLLLAILSTCSPQAARKKAGYEAPR
jgi:putative inorganic carbon (HCO3(-)) transporter